MTEPITVGAAHVFEFIGSSDLAVLLVSVHPIHAFSRPLAQRLTAAHAGIGLGTLDMSDLILTGSPALRFLHQGLRSCDAPSAFGVVPGYFFFRSGEMLGWDSGLPTLADVDAILRSAALGAVVSGLTRDVTFVAQALHLATDHVAAQRVAARFLSAASSERAHSRPHAEAHAAPVDDVYWAYQVLGILPNATDREVHAAWRRRRMETHPDHAAANPGEFERRSRISCDINRARDIIESHRSGRAHGAASRAA
jgi:DnaJ domain